MQPSSSPRPLTSVMGPGWWTIGRRGSMNVNDGLVTKLKASAWTSGRPSLLRTVSTAGKIGSETLYCVAGARPESEKSSKLGMNGSCATRLASTTIVSKVNEGEPTICIVSGVTENGSTSALKVKISGLFSGTPAMFGRLNPTSTIGSGPPPPPPPQETAARESSAAEAVPTRRRGRMRMCGGFLRGGGSAGATRSRQLDDGDRDAQHLRHLLAGEVRRERDPPTDVGERVAVVHARGERREGERDVDPVALARRVERGRPLVLDEHGGAARLHGGGDQRHEVVRLDAERVQAGDLARRVERRIAVHRREEAALREGDAL